MARIRTIKPELRTSLTVAAWPREVRYAWVLLLGYFDDHGRCLDDLRLIVADLFPLDPDITQRKMDRWLDLMCQPPPGDDIPPLCRYGVAGRRFLHAPKWSDHQKVAHSRASRFPACPEHDHSQISHEEFAKDSRANPEDGVNLNGTPPEDFARDSRPRARPRIREQGTGKGTGNREVPTSSGADAPHAITAQTVTAAWITACRDGTGVEPSRSQAGQVGKLAKELLANNRPDHVLAAAMAAGARGFAAFDRELTAAAARLKSPNPGDWVPLPTDPKTGRPVAFG